MLLRAAVVHEDSVLAGAAVDDAALDEEAAAVVVHIAGRLCPEAGLCGEFASSDGGGGGGDGGVLDSAGCVTR